MRKLFATLILVGSLALPMPVAQAATPRFQIRCQTSHVAQVDPIVSRGMPSAHLHEFFGNTTTHSLSTYQSMTGGGTTCSTAADTAGYWVPTLISPDGKVVRAKSILLYYRGAEGVRTMAFPPDLKMVAHSSRVSSSNLIIKFPSCWDGLHTDSADHISHMAEPTREVCPATHPVRVPALTIVARYPFDDAQGHRLSSGALSTMHGDFWNTWDQEVLEALVARCLNDSTEPCPRID